MAEFQKISLSKADNGGKDPDTREKRDIWAKNARSGYVTPPEFEKYWAEELAKGSGSPFKTSPPDYRRDPLSMDPTEGRNPDNGCQCDTCKIFETPMGQATLQWTRSLTRAVREGLEMGADPKAVMNFSLMGPTATAFAGGRMDNEQYATINMVLGDAAKRASILTEPVPDWSHIRKEYEMDLAIQALLDWLDHRLNR
jgi:hypothetical protein